MSIDPEDSLLEEALRGDLPSPDTEARLRRRLLAAGVAIGNGIASTTAAASGAGAASGTAGAGLLAKVVGLSWGVKLGLAAAITIPTVGLMLDRAPERRTVAQSAPLALPMQPQRATRDEAAALPPTAPAAAGLERPEAERAPSKSQRALTESPALLLPPTAPSTTHPSQADFGAPETPARAPQVASTLADETRLLDAAFAALAAGNQKRAAELLNEHEARYPQGLLQTERERAKTRLSKLSRGE